MIRRLLFISFLAWGLASCLGNNSVKQPKDGPTQTDSTTLEAATIETRHKPSRTLSPTAQKLDSLGYVNIAELEPNIAIDIVYATTDNFTGEVLYDDLVEAYLLPEAAEKVARIQRRLKEIHPGHSLIIYDAARPMAAQRRMWEVAVRTGNQYYVANPAKGGGLHNYGAAVDLSIIDSDGNPLPMGTEFDFFGPEANTDNESELVRTGKITQQEQDNRLLLRRLMREEGFTTVRSEWWHFNLYSRRYAVENLKLIDF